VAGCHLTGANIRFFLGLTAFHIIFIFLYSKK